MQRVKVHPHKPMVDAGVEACVSVTPMKKHGRAYYMGTVLLSNVEFVVHPSGVEKMKETGQRNVHAWVTGEIVHEAVEQNEPTGAMLSRLYRVRYDLDEGYFWTVKNGQRQHIDGHFAAAYIVGKKVYVSKESQ